MFSEHSCGAPFLIIFHIISQSELLCFKISRVPNAIFQCGSDILILIQNHGPEPYERPTFKTPTKNNATRRRFFWTDSPQVSFSSSTSSNIKDVNNQGATPLLWGPPPPHHYPKPFVVGGQKRAWGNDEVGVVPTTTGLPLDY